MSTTVLEALENAQVNFETLGRMGAASNPIYMIAMDQLNNAIEAIQADKGLDFVLQDNMFADINK